MIDQNIKLLVATPMYGNLCYGDYAMSILNLGLYCQNKNIPFLVETTYNDALITRARNSLVDKFLSTDFTHILFIDGDISFEVDDVFSMLDANLDVIGGIYSKKRIDWGLIKNAVTNNVPVEHLQYYTGHLNFNRFKEVTEFKLNKPLEVLHVPTGFMLIKREVFQKLDDITPSCKEYDLKGNYIKTIKVYFDTSISNDEYTVYNSEDWHFCNQWRSIGGKVYVAPWVILPHFGTYKFQGAPVPIGVLNSK